MGYAWAAHLSDRELIQEARTLEHDEGSLGYVAELADRLERVLDRLCGSSSNAD